MTRRLLPLLILVLFTAQVMAQDTFSTPTPTPAFDALNTSIVDAYFEVDNDTPQLGEHIYITFTVDTPADIELVNWPELQGDEKLEVIEIGERTVEETETRIIYTQTTEAVLWEPGEYLSEEIIITYRLGDRQESAPVRSFFAFVPRQIEEDSNATLRPSHPPIDLPYVPRWIYAAAAGGVVLAIFLIARLLQVGKRDVVRIVAGSPTQIAIAQLEDLKLQNLPAAAIYPLVADNLRQYLRQQFGIDAVEMTTFELMTALQQADLLSKKQRQGLKQLLEQADLVKFARFQPDEATSQRLINYAIKWVREVDRQPIKEVKPEDD